MKYISASIGFSLIKLAEYVILSFYSFVKDKRQKLS